MERSSVALYAVLCDALRLCPTVMAGGARPTTKSDRHEWVKELLVPLCLALGKGFAGVDAIRLELLIIDIGRIQLLLGS